MNRWEWLISNAKLQIYEFSVDRHESYAVLCEADLPWQRGKTYEIAVRAHGAEISVCCEDVTLTYRDAEAPYLHGAVGVSVANGSHLCFDRIAVKGLVD